MNNIWIFSEIFYVWLVIFASLFELSIWYAQLDWFFLEWNKCLALGLILRCSILVKEGEPTRIVLLPSRITRWGFHHIAWVYPLHHAILLNVLLCSYELNTLDAGRSRSMCGVIVVDAQSFRSTWHGCDAYIHDHCLRYHHKFALFYQLLGSNLLTHHNNFYLKRNL